MSAWHFYLSETPDGFSDKLLYDISDVFADGFGISKGWSIEGVRQAINRSSILGVLIGEHDEVSGYAFYSAPNVDLNGGYMLWEDAICVRKHLHGNRLSSRLLLEKACGVFEGRRFDWIGGRTQNPLVILRYSNLGTLFPFDHLYHGEEGNSIMKFLLDHINEVRDVRSQLDLNTGICRAVYSEGRLGDYSSQIERAERFEKLLSEWGFHRENGDAVLTVAKLSQPIYASL